MLALLLCLVFVFSFLGCQSNGSGGDDGMKEKLEDFEYEEVVGGLEITKYIGNDEKIVIPEVIDNKTVISIAEETFSGNIKLQEIVLPKSITKLNFDLFKNCTSLLKITYSGTISSTSGSFKVYNEMPALKTLEFAKIYESAISRLNGVVDGCDHLENIVIKEIIDPKENDFLINIEENSMTQAREMIDRTINITIPSDAEKAYLEMPMYKKFLFNDEDGMLEEYTRNGLGGYAAFEGANWLHSDDVATASDEDKNKIEEWIEDVGDMDELMDWEVSSMGNGDGYSDWYDMIGRMKRDEKEYVFTGKMSVRADRTNSELIEYEAFEGVNFYEAYELVDNSSVMCIIFGVSNVTVNGKNYKFSSMN